MEKKKKAKIAVKSYQKYVIFSLLVYRSRGHRNGGLKVLRISFTNFSEAF